MVSCTMVPARSTIHSQQLQLAWMFVLSGRGAPLWIMADSGLSAVDYGRHAANLRIMLEASRSGAMVLRPSQRAC